MSNTEQLEHTAQDFRDWWANNFDDFTAEANGQLTDLDNDFAVALGQE